MARHAVDADAEVEVFDPAYEAHQLRIAGETWRDVAAATGYANEIVAQLAVQAYLQKAAMLQSEEHARHALTVELERLEALHKAWWKPGQQDDKAAAVLLRISAQRVKIYEMMFASKEAGASPRTIVITGATEDYVAGLKAIATGALDEDEPEI